MPFSSGAVHVPQPLIDQCIAYDPAEDDYIRGAFFGRKPVQHDTDKIWQVSKADTLRLYDLKASDQAKIPLVTYRTNGQATYTCVPFAAGAVLSPMEMKNADTALRHELRQSRQCMVSLGIGMEYLAINDTLRSTAVMTANETLAAGELWDDFSSANSDPIVDLQGAISQIRVKVGRGRKKVEGGGGRIKIAMGEFTAMTLQQHPNVLSRLSYNPTGTGAILTQKILADVLGVAESDIVVTAAQYTSAQQGETAAFKTFLGSDVVIAYVDESDPYNDYCLGHEYIFDGLAGDDQFLVRRWRDENMGYAGVDNVGVACVVDYKVTNVDAGFLFKGVLDVTDTERYASLID